MSDNEITSLLTTIGPILGSGLTLSATIWRDRPKISKIEELGTVINYTNNMRISKRRYELKWGFISYDHFPPWRTINGNGKYVSYFSNIFLTEISKESTIEFIFFRFGKLEDKLSSVGYKVVDNPWDHVKKIYLQTRKYYLKNKIKTIFTIVKTKISSEYRSRISVYVHDDFIEISNNNYFQIVNYEIDLPHNIKMQNIDRANKNIDIVERVHDPDSFSGEHLKLIIREIPSKQVVQSGTIKIPFIPS